MEEAPVREVRPVVVPAQYFVVAPLLAAFLSVFPGMVVLAISNIIGAFADPFGAAHAGPILGYGLAAYVVSFVAVMGLLYVKMFQEPGRTTYSIYRDRVEFDEGLLNRQRRTVIFDQVADVSLSEGLLQQTCGAGTVTLVTRQLVSGQDGRLSNLSFSLVNVPQPREVYELVRSLALKRGG